METASLLEKIEQGGSGCRDKAGRPVVTLVDFRTEPFLKTRKPVPYIKTDCPTVHCLLDDLKNPRIRGQIPQSGLVVLVSETGNRDWAAIRYLSRYGYTNVLGLQYGMRGWLKSDFPVEYLREKPGP